MSDAAPSPSTTEEDRRKDVVTAIKRFAVDHPEYDGERALKDFEDFYSECPKAEAAYAYVLSNAAAYERGR